MVPNGAAEQDGVLEDDGQARSEGLQRQLSDVDVVNHNPPCKKKKMKNYVSVSTEDVYSINKRKEDLFSESSL